MSWYNLTAINASGVLPLTKSVRNLYFEPLGEVILLIVFFVSFISFSYFNSNPKLNFMFSSFAIAIFSLFLSILGLVQDFTPYFCWGFFALTIAIVALNK